MGLSSLKKAFFLGAGERDESVGLFGTGPDWDAQG